MDLSRFVQPSILVSSFVGRVVLPALSFILIAASIFCIFTVVPSEAVMGAVQRIFYFHVASAMSAYAMVAVLFLASLLFLVTKNKRYDFVAEGAASVGFLLCSFVLISGMIWGHSAWNTWWRWEPRLVSVLLLWLLFIAYFAVRISVTSEETRAKFSAVLGILLAINVPIVIFSIKLLSHTEQLHPEVLPRQGLRDASYVYTLVLSNFAFLALSCWLLWLRVTAAALADDVLQLRRRASQLGI